MSNPTPAAGKTHHLVLRYGPPSNETSVGLMVAGGDLGKFSMQPYTPFAPQSRQGDATIKDFNWISNWEFNNGFDTGTGRLNEGVTESSGYAFAGGQDYVAATTIGPTLFTGRKGALLPPPADTRAAAGDTGQPTIDTFMQFISFGADLYGLTNATPGVVYRFETTGKLLSTPTSNYGAVETLTVAGTQMMTDGATLYACQGAANAVRKTTNGYTWTNHTFNAHYMAVRDEGVIAYIATATLTPGTGYAAATVGWSGTTATNMVFYKGALWIGKPEGLYTWTRGVVEARFPTLDHYSTSNFTKMAVNRNLLYFNVGNHLFFTDGSKFVELYPEDTGGFDSIGAIAGSGSFGPLLIGAKMKSKSPASASSGPLSPSTLANETSYGAVAWTNAANAASSNNSYATAVLTPVAAATTSATDPGTAATAVGGHVDWTNASNITSSDNAYATCALDPATAKYYSYYLKATNFSFAIPATASITGVTVEIERKQSDNSAGSAHDFVVQLLKGGAVPSGSDNKAALATLYPLADAYASYGGSADMWGTTLNPADVNASTFGVTFMAKSDSVATTVSVDHIRVTISYATVQNPSQYLKATNFGFSLPAAAQVRGIQVEVEAKATYSPSIFQSVKIVKGGTITGNDHGYIGTTAQTYQTLTASDAYYTFGSATDLWGTTWAYGDINATTFGVVVSMDGPTRAGNNTMSVDHIRVTVYYDTGSAVAGLNYVFMFQGPEAPGLNPLWSDAAGTLAITAVGTTNVYDNTKIRAYICQGTTGTVYLALNSRYEPDTYHVKGTTQSYIDLTEHSGGFSAIKKWYYECVLSVRDPKSTTYATVWYAIDNGAWTQTTDEAGAAATLQLGSRSVGCYFPLNTMGSYIQLRIYMWSTLAGVSAEINRVTVKGYVAVTPRYQIAFPVDCSQEVRNLVTGAVVEKGEVIYTHIKNALAQQYPVKLQDPWGNWHLCSFRPPAPLAAVESYEKPSGNAPARLYTVVQMVLMEIDALSSAAAYNAWTPG